MIKVSKQFKREIYMIFDHKGCDDLYYLFKRLKHDKACKINIDFDLFIIKNKLKGKMIDSVDFEISNEVDGSEISYFNENVIWKMDEESLEIALERFRECKITGFFAPAEFMYLKIDKKRELDYLYCELV